MKQLTFTNGSGANAAGLSVDLNSGLVFPITAHLAYIRVSILVSMALTLNMESTVMLSRLRILAVLLSILFIFNFVTTS